MNTKKNIMCGSITVMIIAFVLIFTARKNPIAHTHDWGAWTQTKEPTCTTTGIEIRICSLDASHPETRTVPISPDVHQWGDWIVTKAATQTQEGEKTRICKLDSSHKETDRLANPISIQEVLDEAEIHQASASSAEFISAAYDPDLEYVILTYKVGTIKNMFLQYISTVVVADPNLQEFTYARTVGFSETEQIENINITAMNFNATVLAAGAGAFAGASVFAGLASLTGLGPQAKANAYAIAGAAAGKFDFDLTSVTTRIYTRTYQSYFFETNEVKYDMRGFPAGKKYAVAAFADVGIYQILKYDPQTKTAAAIPGKSLWFNVESRPAWDIYEYSREEELSIPQQLTPFEKVNVEVKETELYAGLEKSQTITFYVGNPRVSGWYRTDWKPITLILPLLREFGYKTVSFKWETYWAENASSPDCTAHVILDCADINEYRENGWSYYDQIVNPGAGWKWATWNFSSPIGTVTDRPNIRCAYGYDRHDNGSYYDLSGTVSVTVTAQK